MDHEIKNWYLSVVTEIFRDQYVDPSIEWTALPAKKLQIEYEAFVQKKRQAESRNREDPKDFRNLHFGYYPIPNYEFTSFDADDSMLENLMSSYLGERLIKSGRELKKGELGLKWILGNHGCAVPRRIQSKFQEIGICLESFPLSRSEEKRIAIQAFAQVISHEIGSDIVTVIKDRILDCDQDERTLMYLDNWRCVACPSEQDGSLPKDQARTIQRLIASILPRRGKAKIEVPRIFEKQGGVLKINFGILDVTIYLIARLLFHRGHSLEMILNHPILREYKDQVPKFPYHTIAFYGYVKEAMRDHVKFLSRKK